MNTALNTADDRGLVILMALGKLGKHVYGGTVSHAEKTRRRAANKTARASRRINRVAR
jgi:hypothetical protein